MRLGLPMLLIRVPPAVRRGMDISEQFAIMCRYFICTQMSLGLHIYLQYLRLKHGFQKGPADSVDQIREETYMSLGKCKKYII